MAIQRLVLILLLLLLFHIASFEYALSQNQFQAQWDALKSLQAAWNNTPDPETNLQGWTSITGQSDPCYFEDLNIIYHKPWRGVQCLRLLGNGSSTSKLTRIIGLTLSSAFLRGSLPSSIGNLSPLVTLSLIGNPNLTGPIPREIANLSDSLSTLDLPNNGFSQSIPLELSRLSILHRINFSGNEFTGQFPNFTSMASLQTLILSNNHFEGNLSLFNFSSLNQLITLDLSHNHFSTLYGHDFCYIIQKM